jgi:hypothetical protein
MRDVRMYLCAIVLELMEVCWLKLGIEQFVNKNLPSYIGARLIFSLARGSFVQPPQISSYTTVHVWWCTRLGHESPKGCATIAKVRTIQPIKRRFRTLVQQTLNAYHSICCVRLAQRSAGTLIKPRLFTYTFTTKVSCTTCPLSIKNLVRDHNPHQLCDLHCATTI